MILTAVLLLAAAPAAPDPSPRARGDLAIRARDILKRHCAACHGDAPRRGDVSVLDHGKLTADGYPVPLVSPAAPPKSLLLDLIRDGSMPPGGRARPTADEVTTLADWVAAGAPGYPRTFDDRYAADAAFADWTKQAQKPTTRYLSFAHLVRDGEPLPNLGRIEEKLGAALRAGSGKDVPLAAADPAATVFRINLTDAGWDKGDLFDRGLKNDAHPLTAFDVILLEYPHAAAAAWAGAAASQVPQLAGVRKVPVVRGDWFAEALAPNTALAADVRALVELAKPGNPPCGPRVGRFFGGPATGHPPEAWYAGDPADDGFKVEVVTGDGFTKLAAEVKAGEPYKLRVTTDRPRQLLALRVLADGYTTIQTIERTAVQKGSTLLGPRANGPLVSSAPADGDSETNYFVLFASDAAVPPPTLLVSRHNPLCEDRGRKPISRVLFEPTDPAFDPSKLLRRVVPVTVRK